MDYQLIVGCMYKLDTNGILQRCVLEHERSLILLQSHEAVARGCYERKDTKHNILNVGLWWPALLKDAKDFFQNYNVSQKVGKPSKRDEITLCPQLTLNSFEKWAIDFIRPINPLEKRLIPRYIITAMDYLIRRDEAKLVCDSSAETIMQFIFENVVMRFGCPKILMIDQGTHFINRKIVPPIIHKKTVLSRLSIKF